MQYRISNIIHRLINNKNHVIHRRLTKENKHNYMFHSNYLKVSTINLWFTIFISRDERKLKKGNDRQLDLFMLSFNYYRISNFTNLHWILWNHYVRLVEETISYIHSFSGLEAILFRYTCTGMYCISHIQKNRTYLKENTKKKTKKTEMYLILFSMFNSSSDFGGKFKCPICFGIFWKGF